VAKSFSQAFKEAREEGLSQFIWEGTPYTTELEDKTSSTQEESNLNEIERLRKAMQDYKDNYANRGIADVEYRADLDPFISGSPISLLGFDEINRETGGDIGQRMKVILGEDDPNNIIFYEGTPDEVDMYGSTALGFYSPDKDERYFGKKSGPGIPGGAYASTHYGDPLVTMAEELGHKGMRVLEQEDRIPEYPLHLEEDMMKVFEGRTRANIPADDYYTQRGLNKRLLDWIDDNSLAELRKRGRPSTIKNKVEQLPEESIVDMVIRWFKGEEKPAQKRQELYRYSNGGIVSLIGKD
tara:strand:- start:101 stop:991 length:891 start_codon:yes stop_codon:yes gene_type:complete